MRLIGVFILTIILVGILGCDTNDPLSAEEEEVVEEEILMAKGAEIVSSSAIAAAAPSIVKRVAMSDTLMVSLSHEETESDGDEIVGVRVIRKDNCHVRCRVRNASLCREM